MNLYPGIILKCISSPDDPHFEEALVFITEHDAKGAMGFVVNKLFSRTLNELEEFKHAPSVPLYDGGPMDREHLFFIHCRPDLIESGLLVRGNIYYGGNFKQAVQAITDHSLPPKDLKIFIGYCGWDEGQLEMEIEEGGWVVAELNEEFLFS